MNHQSSPPALPHGAIRAVFAPSVFFVTGTARLGFGVECSRNMVILRNKQGLLCLINTVRLDERGLRELEKLGRVAHVLRIGSFHSSDDLFYQQRYEANLGGLANHTSRFGERFDFRLQERLDDAVFPGARVFHFQAAERSEAVILLEKYECLITCDSVQNWSDFDDGFFSILGRVAARVSGLKGKCSLGVRWLAKTPSSSLEALRLEHHTLAQLPWRHLLPAHGYAVVDGTAREAFKDTLERNVEAFKRRSSLSWIHFAVLLVVNVCLWWRLFS